LSAKTIKLDVCEISDVDHSQVKKVQPTNFNMTLALLDISSCVGLSHSINIVSLGVGERVIRDKEGQPGWDDDEAPKSRKGTCNG